MIEAYVGMHHRELYLSRNLSRVSCFLVSYVSFIGFTYNVKTNVTLA